MQSDTLYSNKEELDPFAKRYKQENGEEDEYRYGEAWCAETAENRHNLMSKCEQEQKRDCRVKKGVVKIEIKIFDCR